MTPNVRFIDWTCFAAAAVSAALGGCAAFPHNQPSLAERRNADSAVNPADELPRTTQAPPKDSDEQPAVVAAAFLAPGRDGAEPAPPDDQGDVVPVVPEPLSTLEGRIGETPPPSASKGAMTLDQIINATLLADPTLRAGFEAINQAAGDALTASLRPNPTLAVDQTLLPLVRPFTEEAQGGPPQLDVAVAYPIDWFLFGKRAAAMQAAGLGVRVSEAEYADLVRRRVLEAATAYYDLLEAKALLDLTRQDAANLRRVEELTQKAVEGGGRPQVELSRVRLDRLRAEQGVRDAENALVAARARTLAVMGRDDAAEAFDAAGSLDDVAPFEPPAVEEAYAVAVENRPDVASLRLRVAQANAELLTERRNAFPEVAVQAGYTRQFQKKAIGFPDADSYGVGFEMGLPLSDRNQGNRLRAAATAAQQRFELQARLVELRAEVVQAEKELRTAAANAEAVAQEQLRLAVEVRDSLNKAYAAGGRPLIDVLDAQRNYRETYRIYIESRAALGRAVVQFNAVLGRSATP
jgi:cobalt-zinc-cadmium efflux system outer membrane protein